MTEISLREDEQSPTPEYPEAYPPPHRPMHLVGLRTEPASVRWIGAYIHRERAETTRAVVTTALAQGLARHPAAFDLFLRGVAARADVPIEALGPEVARATLEAG